MFTSSDTDDVIYKGSTDRADVAVLAKPYRPPTKCCEDFDRLPNVRFPRG